MERPIAYIVLNTSSHTHVVCPYCGGMHKHGLVIGKQETRSSHCHKGEYLLEDVSPSELYQSIETRKKALLRSKKYHTKRKEAKQSDSE